MKIATVIREPSLDDKGDWYAYVDGDRLPGSYWSEEEAHVALLQVLCEVHQ
jgi:hypothetical protein